MDGMDLGYLVRRLGLVEPGPRLDTEERLRLFAEPRSHGAWLPHPVPDALLEEALALARLVAKSKLASTLRRARATILRLNAAAPWPAASKDLSNVVKDASKASIERSQASRDFATVFSARARTPSGTALSRPR